MVRLLVALGLFVQPSEPVSTPQAAADAVESAYVIDITTAAVRDLCEPVIDELLEDAKARDADLIVLRVEAEQELRASLQDYPSYYTFWSGLELAGYFDRQVEARWDEPPRVVAWVVESEGPATQFALAVRDRYFATDAVMSWGDEPPGPSLSRRADGPVTLYTRRNLLTWLADRAGVDRGVVERLAGVVPGRDGSLPPGVEQPIPGFALGVEEATDGGVARGAAASLEELLDLIAPDAELAVDTESAAAILERWSDGLASAEASIVDVHAQYQRAKEQESREGQPFEERRAAREEQLRCLDKMLGLLRRYGVVLDPTGEVAAQFELDREALRVPPLSDRRP